MLQYELDWLYRNINTIKNIYLGSPNYCVYIDYYDYNMLKEIRTREYEKIICEECIELIKNIIK